MAASVTMSSVSISKTNNLPSGAGATGPTGAAGGGSGTGTTGPTGLQGPTGPGVGSTGPTGPAGSGGGGSAFPVSDSVFSVVNGTSSGTVNMNLEGMSQLVTATLGFTGGLTGSASLVMFQLPDVRDNVVYDAFPTTLTNKIYSEPVIWHMRTILQPGVGASPIIIAHGGGFSQESGSGLTTDNAGVIAASLQPVPGVSTLTVFYGQPFVSIPSAIVISPVLSTPNLYFNSINVRSGWDNVNFVIEVDLVGTLPLPKTQLISHIVM